jgi:type VI secretion system protein
LRPKAKLLLFLFLVISLLSCSAMPTTRLEHIKISATADTNQNSPTQIDIVFVYDVKILKLLPKTGPDWFEQKAALQSGSAAAIDVVSLQVPPASLLDVPLPKRHNEAITVYSYANYLSDKGQAMGDLTRHKTMQILLTHDNVIYQEK